jgi:RimJ/RimL family protein N-acetyltransferase
VDYLIRPICAEDAGREREFICGLSEASRYSRLMYAVREPSEEFIERMVQVDRHYAMAFVAVVGDGIAQRIIGVARYASAPGSSGSEFAIAVADPWQSRGVGRAIALRLIEHAREQGIHHLDARILATNLRMLGLARWLGFSIDSNRDEFSVLDARLDLSTNQDKECKSRSILTTTSTATSPWPHQYAPRSRTH